MSLYFWEILESFLPEIAFKSMKGIPLQYQSNCRHEAGRVGV